ncbi:hypothetical protein D3C84_815500 [compost metagenome]
MKARRGSWSSSSRTISARLCWRTNSAGMRSSINDRKPRPLVRPAATLGWTMAQRHRNSKLPDLSLRGSMPKNSSSPRRASKRQSRAYAVAGTRAALLFNSKGSMPTLFNTSSVTRPGAQLCNSASRTSWMEMVSFSDIERGKPCSCSSGGHISAARMCKGDPCGLPQDAA